MANPTAPQTGSFLRNATRLLARRPRWVLAVLILALLATGAGFGWQAASHRRDRAEGLRLSWHGNFAAAEPLLQHALERNARDVEVLRALALGYLHAEQAREAEACLDHWCALRPNQAEPHERRLELFLGMQRFGRALEAAERVLAADPDHLRTQQQVAMLLILEGRHADAERSCRWFLQRRPGQSGLLYFLAQACHGQGKIEEARAILDPLLQAYPRYADALLLRAILYREADQEDKAIPLLRQALAQAPANRLAHYHLSQALARTGQAAEAEHELAEMLRQGDVERLLEDVRIQPDNLDLQIRAVETLLSTGRADEGVRLLEKVLARHPGHVTALRLLAAYQETSAGRGARSP